MGGKTDVAKGRIKEAAGVFALPERRTRRIERIISPGFLQIQPLSRKHCPMNFKSPVVQRTAKQAPQVKIAVAEDEPDIRNTFVRLLELLGHKVICAASNGAELLEQCSGQEVDVVFVDLDMPVMDGLAAAQHLADKGIPVILISGHPDAERIVLQHEPVVLRVSKPATLECLQSAIEHALTEKGVPRRPK